jgi:flagellum-specific peptidoglycan hydrolase FlgJ
MTGFSFAHGRLADMTSPTSMPVHLLAYKKTAGPASANDSALRAAIVKSANHYLSIAQNSSPAEMEAMIWQNDSIDGADHGESCAAFASLTLQEGAQATGQQSWVTGGTTYPWPLHQWADVRVDPNPDSLGIISVLQDAQAHQRWHPLGDGYTPLPGDWVLFDGHVEVVTNYSGGVLYTIGGDSTPNLSVNAHQYNDPLSGQGVAGFVNNGELLSAASQSSGGADSQPSTQGNQAAGRADSQPSSQGNRAAGGADSQQTAIPGLVAPSFSLGGTDQTANGAAQGRPASTSAAQAVLPSTAAIPGAQPVKANTTSTSPGRPSPRYSRNHVPSGTVQGPGTAAQQAFISQVAPGALAAQQKYGIPAAVTIAQAIDESGWGQSELAIQHNNLFGIKGSGPAGSVTLPTQEYQNGQTVSTASSFRVYNSLAESIVDHSLLLATGSSYRQAMADRQAPDTFANDLTGVYATDPSYGANLISLMRLYNLYRFDTGTPTAQASTAQVGPTQAGAAQDATGQGGSGESAQGEEEQGTTTHGGTAGGIGGMPGAELGVAAKGASRPEATGLGGAAPQVAVPVAAGPGGARIPGLLEASGGTPVQTAPAQTGPVRQAPQSAGERAFRTGPRSSRVSTRRYVPQIPQAVTADFVSTAKTSLLRAEPLYRDVAGSSGIRWELLAACDWMQCKAQPRYSPVQGEKLGTRNPDGTVYRTKSQALTQCAGDLIELALAVYRIDLTERLYLSVRELANVFAAFRWGGLLRVHRISAMEFPYSVAGLTAQHMKMRWPDMDEPHAPDRPGTRFRMPFGAVPVVLGLDYPAVS